ncbi:MAG TPA: YihY/virulence factor BrkB family protein [Bacteroidales bacterium]|nr:YihY/virulence factor BrkB family protein [Bacteroidales bacterium]HCU18880.1 YihY/virulence factor BrkB family protein [Bacteroidales bacterium]
MANMISWTLTQVKRINDTIWHTPLSEISKVRGFVIKQLRILIIAARGFAKDKVNLRASALTFYTLLSIIPVIAIAFAIAKGFGLDQDLKTLISDEFQAYQSVLNPLLEKAQNAIEETRGGYMAGVGMIILFWSVMSLLEHIESSFNHIWQIRISRPWYRKFTDYLTMMLIAPVFIILSSSITIFVGTELVNFMSRAPILGVFKPIISFLIKLAPFFLTWITMTILFIIMPNTKVKFVPALIAGIITGTILQGLQWLYLDLQFGIMKLSAIYGSFALIPLFILWIQSSWIVVLLGAELSFANQNISRYEFESEALNVSNFQKRALVLMIMHMIIKNFEVGEKPVSAEYIGTTLKIPVRLARDILQDLSSVNLVSIILENQQKESLYQPALDINRLTVSFVFSRLDKKGTEQTMVIRNKDYERVISMLEKFDRLIAKSGSNILIKDL